VTERVERLRQRSVDARASVSSERASLLTAFYRENEGKHSPPVMRALAFRYLCEHKTIYIGPDELIVGERGPEPKATPTYPELTCHSLEDLRILNDRPKTSYSVSDDVLAVYEKEIIPFWRGRSLRDRMFERLPERWKVAYEAGIFTEFMEQRAPGHTVADGKIYGKGMLDFKAEIAEELKRLDTEPGSADARTGISHDAGPGATPRNPLGLSPDELREHRREELRAMDIVADALVLFAERHAVLAEAMSVGETDPERVRDLEAIAATCRRVPAKAPRTFQEALQMYWFCHLAVITELNGWDAFNPGHLDQHVEPFYKHGIADNTLTRDRAKELLECFFIKFNNHLAPPKVGVTAAESGTHTDFANINLGGVTRDGSDGTNEVSYLLLEVIDELHILQPSQNVQVSQETPDAFLRAAARVIRKGYGYPSVFSADAVVAELTRQGKSLQDAREGGTSGCVETGAFGKEAYILTGYFNLPKVLELALNNGVDPRTGVKVGPETGDLRGFSEFGRLLGAFGTQLHHFIETKIEGNNIIERMYAEEMPAPFLSLITDDCIAHGLDYNEGGARYNTSYIQGVGIGTITDSLSALRKHVFTDGTFSMDEYLEALANDFEGAERLRLLALNRTPKWGNDDDAADGIMRTVFEAFFRAVDGRPNVRGGTYHIDMLPTTCHIYFGSVTGATPDGRRAWTPLSEGISPVQGADIKGPTAVFLSAAKMDHARTGGTLLNMKFAPDALAEESDLDNLVALIRGYFRLGGHHVQFNVVSADTLRDAQEHPERHRDLLVRVAGYSDYFCDISSELQDEIISRTEQRKS
jgi:pyruvate formate-lyase/glycerol dehydratase family glycyl radical enzyme